MPANTSKRRGFTLPEVLVTLAIVATLAAVLIPSLNNQLSKGDAGRLTSDLVAIQTAVGAFVSDVRRYPADLTDLETRPVGENDLLNAPFGSVLVAKWRGPYLSKELSTGGGMPTGYGATISGNFSKDAVYNAIDYLKISVGPITEAEFNNIDQIIDESASSSSGQLRFDGTSISGTATFYAVPIQ